MQLDDITVEVRDKNLRRLGMIRPEDLSLDCGDTFNNVGEWTLTLASEHPLAGPLSTPGAGIIVTGPTDVLFSGPMVTPQTEIKTSDPIGTLTISGVTDTVVLADMLSLPDPTNPDPSTQVLAHDTRTGPAESLMHAYVRANIGIGAPLQRRRGRPDKVTMLTAEDLSQVPASFYGYGVGVLNGTDQGRGPVITKSPRFAVLGTLLEEIALVANLGFRVVQRDSDLVFETWAVQDRSAFIRLSVLNGNLTSQKVAITAPAVTRVVLAGSGEQEDRTIVAGTNAAALSAEVEWGRRIESFVDQRQTDDMTVYTQKINEVLADGGFTGIDVQMVPTDDNTMQFLRDYNLGDKVAVVLSDYERTSLATGYVLKVDSSGVRFGVLLGNAAEFDESASTAGRISDAEQRISYLERADPGVTQASVDGASVLHFMGVY